MSCESCKQLKKKCAMTEEATKNKKRVVRSRSEVSESAAERTEEEEMVGGSRSRSGTRTRRVTVEERLEGIEEGIAEIMKEMRRLERRINRKIDKMYELLGLSWESETEEMEETEEEE